MNPTTRHLTALFVAFGLALPAWGQQYYLYTPKEVTPDEKGERKEGVLVKEIPIQKGDTLYGLSRKFSKHGMYFPQILLFNDIKNPDLIYAGQTLRIPVGSDVSQEKNTAHDKKAQKAPRKEAVLSAPAAVVPQNRSASLQTAEVAQQPEAAQVEMKRNDTGVRNKKKNSNKKTDAAPVTKAAQQLTPQHPEKVVVSGSGDATGGQKMFERAVKAYKQEDFRTALELFDKYLSDNQNSPLAADASLYKAECYLKLSVQQ